MTSFQRAEKAAKEYGAEGAKVYTDYKEMLADKSVDIDVVHVCTPNVADCPITVAAFEAGKHVMCEKPMAHNKEDAQKMLDVGKLPERNSRSDTRTVCVTIHRHFTLPVKTENWGDIYFAKAHALRRRAVPTWRVFPNKALQGGGPLIDIGTHALDITLWMMNNYEPAFVSGTGNLQNWDVRQTVRKETYSDHGIRDI